MGFGDTCLVKKLLLEHACLLHTVCGLNICFSHLLVRVNLDCLEHSLELGKPFSGYWWFPYRVCAPEWNYHVEGKVHEVYWFLHSPATVRFHDFDCIVGNTEAKHFPFFPVSVYAMHFVCKLSLTIY